MIGGGALLAAFLIWQLAFADKRSKLNVEKDKITISTVSQGDFDEFNGEKASG
jgi:HlyD family secretion protein